MIEPLDKALESMTRELNHKINQQKREDNINYQYYRGLQKIAHLGVAVPPEVQPFAFPFNWCRTYVNVLIERQEIRMFLRDGQMEEDEELRADWQTSNMDLQSCLAHRDLAVLGRSFISVSADPAGGRPRMRVESPRFMAALVSPTTYEMEGALRVFKDGGVMKRVLYLPDQTILQSQQNGVWGVEQRIVHDLGRVPIIMMLNEKETGAFEGETLMADLKPIVDTAARVMLALQLGMETVATLQKVATGLDKKDFVDEDGQQLDAWQTYLGAILALSNPDAKITQLPGADLRNFHETIKMLAEQASTVTGLPVRMMGQNTANPPTEGTVLADESRLVKQVEMVEVIAGHGYSWALGICERIRKGSWDSDGRINTVWHNPGTPTTGQRSDFLQKATGGRPYMSVRGAMHEMGWSQPRIDRELSWLAEEQTGYGDIDRTFL